jgi:hypothetical protein
MCKSVVLPLLAVLAISVCPVSAAMAAEVDSLPPQLPARTASGATNINDVWLHNGGGRLYQNTLVAPRQIALEGARFVDPASVPELALTPPADKKAPVRHARKAKVAKPAHAGTASGTESGTPPMGVGKTSLKAPEKTPASTSAKTPAGDAGGIPPLSAAGTGSSSAAGGAAGADSPYSSAAASPVGGVGGSATTPRASMPGLGGGGAPVPAVSADDILPRANARP